MTRIESIRLVAGVAAGLGDVSEKVLPKVGILSKPRAGGAIKSQYLTPHFLHPSHALTGAICISAASKAKGTVAADLAEVNNTNKETIIVEHSSGVIPIEIEIQGSGHNLTIISAATLRTARKIMDGFAYY